MVTRMMIIIIRSLLTLASLCLAQNVVNEATVAAVAAAALVRRETNSEIRQQHDQERIHPTSQSRFKSSGTISDPLQSRSAYTSGKASIGNNQDTLKLFRSAAQVAMPQLASSTTTSRQNSVDEYRCANYCSCSVIQVMMDKSNEKKANLTQARCESSLFTDLLTIDRRTHIIHISLPNNNNNNNNNRDEIDASDPNAGITSTKLPAPTPQRNSFRMPRLIQFNLLREIVIINLRFEVCDSEVFKKGQKMRRLQLNYNRLSRISKACLKHLDKLVELNLDYNQLEELESALFNSLLNLKSLSIANNQLTELAAHQFANLTNLVSLNLVGNSFKSINLQLFEPMQNSLRLLLLAKNQIKSFVQAPIQQQQTTTTNIASISAISNNNNNTPPGFQLSKSRSLNSISNSSSSSSSTSTMSTRGNVSPFIGVIFKDLMKLNVDENKFERVKLLQLHRFFNIKYLSIRKNNIATIRDKAFNGLKLVELNLAHNQLQTVSKCAFCNATIKRLVLSYNNISLPQLAENDALASLAAAAAATISPIVPRPLALNGTIIVDDPTNVRLEGPHLAAATAAASATLALPLQGSQPFQDQPPPLLASSQTSSSGGGGSAVAQTVASSPNMLILSQSIFGPLFGQLEYLDLSNNQLLADQLELLLEPLLKLEYLNLASTGLDRYLPSPSLFKNLRQLKYLNLSYNQLDQVIAETVEPLTMLEVLDLSHNKFSELDESFLVTVDDMATLKMIHFGSNPWFCSQCKVAPLYDWILRSPIYNLTCIAPSLLAEERTKESPNDELLLDNAGNKDANNNNNEPSTDDSEASPLSRNSLAHGPQHYSLLVGTDDGDERPLDQVDMDLMLGDSLDEEFAGHYNLLASDYLYNGGGKIPASSGSSHSYSLREGLASNEDDPSIGFTMLQVSGALKRPYAPEEYCLKCEFPGELRSLKIHELQSNDFKFCAGAAPRFAASEPKIGLTLAIVIIGALFCIIIIVIVMYRKKSNTYYTNEETDQLDGGETGVMGAKKPVFSISSDAEHQYGDNTDYSSPPMSFDSYSREEEEDDDEDEEEDDDGGLDDEEYLDEEEEDDEDDVDANGQDEELDEDDKVNEEEGVVDDGIGGEHAEGAPPVGHHQHQHHNHQEKHIERGKQKGDNNHGYHHVGYADDMFGAPKTVTDNAAELQTEAENSKRMAAAEQERRHQVAEYHRNERATTGADSQRTSQSQGSSFSPTDRSASGPIPLAHRHPSSSREAAAKRQTSVHQHHHHHHHHHGSTTRGRPGAAAVVAVAVVATAPGGAGGKLARPSAGGNGTSHSTTPSVSLAPSLAAHNGSPKRAGGLSGSGSGSGHSSSSTGARATALSPAIHPAIGSIRRQPSGSQSNQSNNSIELEVKTQSSKVAAAAAAAAASGGGRAALRSNQSLAGSRSQHQHQHQRQRSNCETSLDTSRQPGGSKGDSQNPTTSGQVGSLEEQQYPMIQDMRPQRGGMRTSQASDQKTAKLRPHSSGGQQQQQQQRQSSAGTARHPPFIEQPPPGDADLSAIPTQPPPIKEPSGQSSGTANRLGRQRFAVSKEQRSQPAMEWAQLRPAVDPPAAPHSLGVQKHSSGSSNGVELDYGSAGTTLPATRQEPPGAPPGSRTGIASHHHHHHQQQQQQPQQQQQHHRHHQPLVKATERRHSSSVSDATTADSLALEALSYTASELEEPPVELGGALEMADSSGSFGPDEFVNNNNDITNNNNNNNNITNESNSNNNRHHHQQQQQHDNGGRLQAAAAAATGYQMRESRSSHSALTQTGSRDEMI